MSSIYGFLHTAGYAGTENRTEKEEGIARWNRAYGRTEGHIAAENRYFGSYIEHFSETFPEGAPVIQRNGKQFLTDALLYNRDELLPRLHQMPDAPLSDEDILVSLILQDGYEALRDVNGDFAGAVYDEADGTLTLYRDHTGIRQLYYYWDDNQFAFSTDIRSLGALPDSDLALDEEILWMRLTGMNYQSLDRTDFEHMRCVIPGSTLTVHVGEKVETETKRYWKPAQKKIRLANDEAYEKEMRRLIEDAIKRRLDAFPGKVGAELSAGLDSSVIDILIHRMGREAKYVTWRVVPDDWPMQPGDERLILRDICEKEGITCETVPEEWTANQDSVYPVFHNTPQLGEVAKIVSEAGARCVFSGQGGDEGVSHRPNVLELWHYKEYGAYFRERWAETKKMKIPLIRYPYHILHDLFVAYPKRMKKSNMRMPGVINLLNPDYVERMKDVQGFPYVFGIDPAMDFDQGGIRLRPETAAYQAAPYGVRFLFPYQDYRVFDYAVSIPRKKFLRKGEERWIYRKTFCDLMPESLREVDYKDYPSLRNGDPSKSPDTKENEQDTLIIKAKEIKKLLEWNRFSDLLNKDVLSFMNNKNISNVQDAAKTLFLFLHLSKLEWIDKYWKSQSR